jgi:hypothetical protein
MFAARDIKKGELILSERPIAMVLCYTEATLKQLTPEKLHNLLGCSTIEHPYYAYDSEKLMPENKMPEKSDLALGKLTDLVVSLYPWFGECNYFSTRLTGTKWESDLINDIWANRRDASPAGEAPKQKSVTFAYGMCSLNAHEVTPLLTRQSIGKGFFPKSSLINHACNPNADYYFVQGQLCFYASCDIRQNEEITIDYLNCKSSTTERRLRKTIIDGTAKFDCKCVQCLKPQDFVLEMWSGRSQELSAARVNILEHKYDSAIDTIVDAWKANLGELRAKPVQLISDVCLPLIQAHVQHSGLAANKLAPTEVALLDGITALRIPEFEVLAEGTLRNTQKLEYILHAGKLFVCLKPFLMGICQLPENRWFEETNKMIQEIPKEQFDRIVSVIQFDVNWIQDQPYKFVPLEADTVINRIVSPMPILLSAIHERFIQSL